MKVPFLPLFALAALSGSSLAFGFAEFGRGEFLLSTTARATYDSRVWGGLNPADDYIFTLQPDLIYRREAARIKLDALAGLRINRYKEFDELNSEDFVSSLKLELPSGGAAVTSGTFAASYDERTDVNFDVNRRLREKTFTTRLDTNIPTSLKTAVLLGGSYRNDQRNQFSDRRTWDGMTGFRYMNFLGGATFDLTYRRLEVETSGENEFSIPLNQNSDLYSATYSQPIYDEVRGSISYGYRVLRRSRAEVLNGDSSSAGSIVAVNIVGPLFPRSRFPKLESSLSFGYQKAETPGIADQGGSRFFGSGQISWHARERTRLFVNARRSQELSVNDLTVETTSFNIGVDEKIGNFSSASASIGTERRNYKTLWRHDDVFLGQFGWHYRMSKAWTTSVDYHFRDASSSTTSADYARHVVTFSLTYTF